MNVSVSILFEALDQDAWDSMRFVGQSVTNNPDSVRVTASDDGAKWLLVEFTMRTEAQYKAVDKVDRAIRLYAGQRLDSAIGFPKFEAQQARARRKSERRRAKRQAIHRESRSLLPGGTNHHQREQSSPIAQAGRIE